MRNTSVLFSSLGVRFGILSSSSSLWFLSFSVILELFCQKTVDITVAVVSNLLCCQET